MKFYLVNIIIIIIGALNIENSTAQSLEGLVQNIENAISQSNSKKLSTYFQNNVEITINEKEGIYPKTQATFIMKEFFMNYPVQSFRVLHKGNSASTFYIVGEYNSSRGKYDTNIFLKKSSNEYLIESIRFEKEK